MKVMTRHFLNIIAPQINLLLTKHVRFVAHKANIYDDFQRHFGYRVVKDGEKPKIIHQLFENIANSYDLINDVASLGVHRIWRDIFIERLSPTRGVRYLDMAGGTGSVAFRLLKALQNDRPGKETEVVICDINQHMLDVGINRAQRLGYVEENLRDIKINWVCADGENLPFEDNSFDVYTIGFGVRNCTRIDKILSEAFRVLQKGGRFLCLECGHLNCSNLQWLYDQYSFHVIPPLGRIITGDSAPFHYFVESVRKFPKQEDFKWMIEQAGFQMVEYEDVHFGVVSIYSGFKMT